MGREAKRVPLDFNWPLNTVWPGYVMNDAGSCPACKGGTESPEAYYLNDLWHGEAPFDPRDNGSTPFDGTEAPLIAIAQDAVECDPGYYGTGSKAITAEARRLAELANSMWAHHLSADDVATLWAAGRLRGFASMPTPREANLQRLAETLPGDADILIRAECERKGWPYLCQHCGGTGFASPEAKEAADNWQPTEPPTGDGWQMWETVSLGSPISPVFPTAEALAQWLAADGPDEGTAEQWLQMIQGDGWKPTAFAAH